MAYIFLSLTGTQTGAILQPLVACIEADMDIDAIHLYATPKSVQNAETVRDFCQNKGYPKVEITDWDPENTEADIIVLREIIDGHDVIFNVEGGMNYAIAMIIRELQANSDQCDIALVQSQTDRVLLTRLKNGTTRSLPLPATRPVKDILNEQASLEWCRVPPTEPDLCATLAKAGCRLPKCRLTNVRTGGIDFDLVWNDGANRLCFLTTVGYRSPDQDKNETPANKKTKLDRIRRIAMWASSRQSSGQLFDRKIFVICPDRMVAEHIKRESGGKATCFQVNRATFFRKKSTKFTQLRLVMQEIFHTETYQKYKEGRTVESQTLILCCGRDPAGTLSAIAASRLPNILLCHTTDATMLHLVKKVRREVAALPGVKKISLMATDFDGISLLNRLKLAEGATDVHVNISPGTKGQTAFLTLWSSMNGCGIWSMHTKKNAICKLGDDETKPIPPTDPLTLIRFSVDDDTPPSTGRSCLGKKTMDAILHDMRSCMKKGEEWTPAVSGIDLVRGTIKGKPMVEREVKGAWFESLSAHALRTAGACHVHESVKLPWSPDLQKNIEYRYQDSAHRLEMDVIGHWLGCHFLISCKASSKKDIITKAAREAIEMAHSISRFTLPLLCHLGCKAAQIKKMTAEGVVDMASVEHGDLVAVIGWRELCDPELLKKAFTDLHAMLRQTSRPHKGQNTKTGATAPDKDAPADIP